MSRLLFRLQCPSYGLKWLTLTCENGERSELVLVAGGGGTLKTGVPNQLHVFKYIGSGDFDLLPAFDTDRFCSGVCHGVIGGKLVLCAQLESMCLLLSVSQASSKDSLSFKRLVDFTADKQVTCCTIASGDLVTGGEDCVVRIWKLIDGENGTFSISTPREFKGHSGEIMAVAKHPNENWICSASKDGTCKIWDVETAELLLEVPSPDASSGIASSATIKFECRGCVFSHDGAHLYTINNGGRGASHLIKFCVKSHEQEKKKLQSVPVKTVMAHKGPSSCLAISEGGELIAVGSMNGFAKVLHTDTLATELMRVCHDDYPVTDVCFAAEPVAKRENASCFIVTCSVDNRMAAVVSRRRPIWLILFVFLLLLLASYYFCFVYSSRKN